MRDGRLDSAEASVAALQAAGFQTSAQVASAIATALLPYVQQTGLDAALALRDARLDGHDADVLALQTAGPFATSSDLTAAETSLQSAIDAILAQLAALTTGGGSNLINAQAWSGEITWDLLLGTNTLRNLHFNAPLSVSLQNDNFTLSLACDSYSTAQTDAAIATALTPYETAAQRDAAIATALLAYSTTTEMDAAIAAALVQYYTATQVDAQIASAIAGIDLTPCYTSAQTDAAITAALVPVTLSNAPAWGANPPTWKLLKGANVLRNLRFAGPLNASLQKITSDSYEKAETYTQAEVNSVVSGAIDALHRPIPHGEPGDASDLRCLGALLHERAGGRRDRGQRLQRRRLLHQNSERLEVLPQQRQPWQRRSLHPRSRQRVHPEADQGHPAPLAWNLFSGTITELRCDAYSKAEADSRFLSSTGYIGTLDGRYLATNANAGSSEVFTVIRDASAVPRLRLGGATSYQELSQS